MWLKADPHLPGGGESFYISRENRENIVLKGLSQPYRNIGSCTYTDNTGTKQTLITASLAENEPRLFTSDDSMHLLTFSEGDRRLKVSEFPGVQVSHIKVFNGGVILATMYKDSTSKRHVGLYDVLGNKLEVPNIEDADIAWAIPVGENYLEIALYPRAKAKAKQGLYCFSAQNADEAHIFYNTCTRELVPSPDSAVKGRSVSITGRIVGFSDTAHILELNVRRRGQRSSVILSSTNQIIPLGGKNSHYEISPLEIIAGVVVCRAKISAIEAHACPYTQDEHGAWKQCDFNAIVNLSTDEFALRSRATGMWTIQNSLRGAPKIFTDSQGNNYSEFADISYTSLPTSSGNSHKSFVGKVKDGYIVVLNDEIVEWENSAVFTNVFAKSSGGYSQEPIYFQRGNTWYKAYWYYTIEGGLKRCSSPFAP